MSSNPVAEPLDAPQGECLIDVQGLAKSFGGVRALDGVDLTVRAGELVALIGPNGAGKSTLFNCINGQLRPDSGRVLLLGRALHRQTARAISRWGVGRTFQIAATFGSMTVRENVEVALLAASGQIARLWRPARRDLRSEAEALLEEVGLARQGETSCAHLAYGDVKRLEFALALAGRPRLLLMDEPTAGMAPAERQALALGVRNRVRERGLGVLFTEHSMDVVFGHADRVLVLARGRLIAQGSPAEVRDDPAVRRVYLGEGG